MASKQQERAHLDKALRDLHLAHLQVEDGTEPPDFLLRDPADGHRIGVKLTRIYGRENAKGSPDLEVERTFERLVRDLASEYWNLDATQTIQVSVGFPPPIRSRLVRQFTAEERRADAVATIQGALTQLRDMPRLDPFQRHEFEVIQRDGRPVSFHVLGLPPGTGMERRWDVINNTVGWTGIVTAEMLQKKISAKAKDLSKYRPAVDSTALLVVADGSSAAGFLDLAEGTVVDPKGFDAVYYQRFPFDSTEVVRLVGRTE